MRKFFQGYDKRAALDVLAMTVTLVLAILILTSIWLAQDTDYILVIVKVFSILILSICFWFTADDWRYLLEFKKTQKAADKLQRQLHELPEIMKERYCPRQLVDIYEQAHSYSESQKEALSTRVVFGEHNSAQLKWLRLSRKKVKELSHQLGATPLTLSSRFTQSDFDEEQRALSAAMNQAVKNHDSAVEYEQMVFNDRDQVLSNQYYSALDTAEATRNANIRQHEANLDSTMQWVDNQLSYLAKIRLGSNPKSSDGEN